MDKIKTMPKTDLHCHLDGSISLASIRRLAEQNHKPLEMEDARLLHMLQVPKECESLKEYLECFALPLQYLTTPQNFETAAFQLMADAAGEQVMYQEIRFAPSMSMSGEVSAEVMLARVQKGISLAQEEFHMKGNVILIFMRHEPLDHNLALFEQLKGNYQKTFCAIDVAGDEAGFPLEGQRELFIEAKKAGIPFTIHAGECGSVENIDQALELGASRIGHGIALNQSRELRKYCQQEQIGIEMCPTSNLQTKAIGSLEEYPVSMFMEEGLAVSVNTDNRMVSGTSVTKELQLIKESFSIQPEAFIENGINTSFADAEVKEWMKKQRKAYESNH